MKSTKAKSRVVSILKFVEGYPGYSKLPEEREK